MSEYRRSEIVSGLFVFLAIGVFLLFAFKVGGFDLFGLFRGQVLACKSYFTDVKTLQAGVEVKVGGQPVGKVTGVRMVERPLSQAQVDRLRAFYEDKAAAGLKAGMIRHLVEVQFELTDGKLKLNPKTARVALNQGSLLATHFLQLDPGEWLPEEEPRAIFEAELPGEVEVTAQEETGFEELVAIIKPVVGEIDTTLKAINEKILTAENTGAIGRILKNLDQTMVDGGELVTRLETLLDRNKDPRLQEILDNAARASANLKERLDGVQADLQRFLGNASGVLADNRAEIAEIARRLRRTMWQAEMAMRKIRANPGVLLFGDEETDLQAAEVDESGVRQSGRARPYEQRDESESAGD